ncbi:hypothetical protein QAD02_014606 [Eretmocerus hayati]|uniref:Uncharacterized protein n=1 Tax=Eretmocerus hayati TaxID=131215 RepID=A0ACC2P5F0_9HYME|nr:hypothetical protein QAD02_014606 [Eretmocerus hayati]
MDRVPAELHKNVYTLTKFVTPNDDFKKHFKESMFNKPNTQGFIHVSYYLLGIYYKDNFKSKVQWPVIDKQTENKFRNDVRECLLDIANNNPDINFPPVFASHLLLARGTKFIQIMWKFSLVVLRTYISREHQAILAFCPKPGMFYEDTKEFLVSFKNLHYRQKTQQQSDLKAKVLRVREEMKNIINNAPVNDAAKKRLNFIEDSEIIPMWTGFLTNEFESLAEELSTLDKMDKLFRSINNVIQNLKGDSQTLNASNFNRIDIGLVCENLPPNVQVLAYNLYEQDSLNLHSFFSIFQFFVQKYGLVTRKYQLGELKKFNSQLCSSNEDMKYAIQHFQNLHEQISSFLMGELKHNCGIKNVQKFVSNIPEFNKVLFMPSPSIQLNNQYEERENPYQNLLKLTPVEDAHKNLFSRHASNQQKNICSAKRKPFLAHRINFDDSIHDSSIDRQHSFQRRTPSKPKSTFKNMDKYSRIFSTRTPADNRVNNSVMMMMSSTGNSLLPLISKQQNISHVDSCNTSQELSQESFSLCSNMNSTVDVQKHETEAPKSSHKRRSLSDLVERYKKILQRNEKNSQEVDGLPEGALHEGSDLVEIPGEPSSS